VTHWQQISPLLAIFRLMPEEGARFPDYKPGQYIALRRESCRLTKRVVGHDEKAHFIPDLDERGVQRRGPVTHSYSISSAPFETQRDGHLELYVVLEQDEWGYAGRLTDSLFQIRTLVDDKVGYVDRIIGDFTLDRRARGFRNVVMVGTGTGLAPFASMIKQLHHEAGEGRRGRRALHAVPRQPHPRGVGLSQGAPLHSGRGLVRLYLRSFGEPP
jgi:ferredoxin-NADP reductase